jgi:hypothetical protein
MTMLPSRAPLLIVPIRDRRQSRRILTIRNCAISMLAIAVIFASISIYNETRRGAAGDYGRLFGSQVPAANGGVTRKTDVVSEGRVSDQAAPDPMLVAPAAREQLLVSNSNTTTQATTTTIAPVTPLTQPVLASVGHGTTIVGDADGVKIVKAPSTTTAQPVLSGGIFKEH